MDTFVRVTSTFMRPQEQQADHLINEMDVDDNAYLKNVSSNRIQTDRHSLIVHIAAITALVLLVGYCTAVGDVKRITNGYDDCGNVCGEKNYFQINNPECHSQDMTDKPYLFLESVYQRQCVSDCSEKDGVVIFMNRCIKKSSMQIPGKDNDKYISQFARDIKIYLPEIIYSCFISLGFSLIMIGALRFTSGILIWAVLGLIVFAFAALAALFWQMGASEDFNTDSGSTPAAILFSILTIVVITIILMLRKHIQLVIQLLKEAGKALASIPLLYIQPALTVLSIIMLISLWSYFTLLIESAGDLVSINGIVDYRQSGLVRFTFWYNVFMLLWCCQFVYGCQQMITAGAISVWYFARNKSKLDRPIVYSTGNLLKYHMGTVSIGSLVISVVMMLRLLARAFRRYQALACFCRAYLSILQVYIKYFTRNAYIITSIYGYGFHDAGSKAFNLLTKNALTVIAINSAGDFVLAFSKAIVVVASVGVGYALMEEKQGFDNIAVPLMIVGFVAFFIAHCFVTIYELAVDTIFLCFCEDCEVNDGTTRPYYMSRDMMEFVQTAQNMVTAKMGPNQPPITVTVVN